MRKSYSDPTADTALRNLAEQAQREYAERHRKKSPTVVHYSDQRQTFIDFMNGKVVCPKCGSANLDKLGLEPGDHPWMLCRDCGEVIEDVSRCP